MNYAAPVIIRRFAGSCLTCTKCPRPARFPRGTTSLFRSPYSRTSVLASPLTCQKATPKCRTFSSATRVAFQHAFTHHTPSGRETEEKGLAFQKGEIDGEELHDIFGAVVPPPRIANRFLRVLHSRRNDGTLDLPLPPSLEELTLRYPFALDSALAWLRETYPLDEDAAILARIEREDGDENYSPSELEQRAQDAGLYAPRTSEYSGPQSGRYQAQLSGKDDDVFGQSELDKMRAENLAQAEQEEAELQAQIDEKMATYEKLHQDKQYALAERPEQSIETSKGIRPPNSFERWVLQKQNEGQSKLTIEGPEVADTSVFQRIFPSAVFVALVCAGSYLFAQYWVPPKRSDRMYPDVALSFATIGAVVVVNLAVYGMWAFPPCWRLLNRYFVSTPAYPRAVSMLLNTFSHQDTKHLLSNMLGIVLFGLSLHEDIGRGAFMGIYLASGAVGSLASLTFFAVRRQLVSSSLGASGSLWGVMSAFCWLHAEYDHAVSSASFLWLTNHSEKFSIIFLPKDIQDRIQLSGWMLLAGLTGWEIFRLFGPISVVDRASHLGGMAVGVIWAQALKSNRPKGEGAKEKKIRLSWYSILMGNPGGDK